MRKGNAHSPLSFGQQEKCSWQGWSHIVSEQYWVTHFKLLEPLWPVFPPPTMFPASRKTQKPMRWYKVRLAKGLLNDCNLPVGGSISQVLSHSPPTLPWAPLTGGETDFWDNESYAQGLRLQALIVPSTCSPCGPHTQTSPQGQLLPCHTKGLIKLFNQEAAFFRGNSNGWIVVGRGSLQASIFQKLGLGPMGNVTPPTHLNLCRAIKW